MGLDPVSWAVVAVTFVSTAVAYVGYRNTKKLQKQNAGILAQVRSSQIARRFVFGRHRIGAIEINMANSGANNSHLHFIYAWCEAPCAGIDEVRFDEEAVTYNNNLTGGNGEGTGKYAGYLRIEHNVNPDGDNPPFSGAPYDLVGEGGMPGWGVTDLMRGVVGSWFRYRFDSELYGGGIASTSCIMRGINNVYDPRDTTFKYTRNPALLMAYYLKLDPRKGPGLDDTEIAETELIAAANICDELVPLSTGGSESRYTFDGVVSLDEEPEDIIERFKLAMAGTRVYVGGKWRMYAGAYVDPTFVITEDLLVEEVENSSRPSLKDRFNLVRGNHANEDSDWEPVGFPEYRRDDLIALDKKVLLETINLRDTSSRTMCRRLAKIHCMRSRYGRTVNVVCNVEALRAQPGKPVYLDLPFAGFNMTPMDVIRWSCAIVKNRIRISLSLKETNEAIFDWETSEDLNNLPTTPPVEPLEPPPDVDVVGGFDYVEILAGANPPEAGGQDYEDPPDPGPVYGGEDFEDYV